MYARAIRLLLFVALLAPGLLACSGEVHEGELIYGVTALDGSPAATRDIEATVTELDLRLAEAGYLRRTVVQLGPGRIRVVLPENDVGEIPKIRKVLENPAGLRLALELQPR